MRGLTGHWSPSEVPTHCPVLSAAPSRRACTSAAEDRCSTDHPCSEREREGVVEKHRKVR